MRQASLPSQSIQKLHLPFYRAVPALLLALFLLALPLAAQDERELVKANDFSDPSVYGQARGKGLSISYDRFAPFTLHSESADSVIGNSERQVKRFNRLELKLKLPVWNRPNFKVIAGFRYAFEEYNFKTGDSLVYPLFKNLEDKDLKSIGGQIMVLRSFNEVNFLILRVNGDLNGDYKDSPIGKGRYLKTAVSAIYGWKRNEAYSYGIGLQVGYNFGRQSIYPAFLYNRAFNKKWGIEGIFPANLKLRYNPSSYTYMYFGYNVQGNSYNLRIDNPNFSNYQYLEYRQTGLLLNYAIEREVFDFFWVGAEAGYRFNYRNRLVPEGKRGSEAVVISTMRPAPYVSFGLYIVSPRKWSEKDEPPTQ